MSRSDRALRAALSLMTTCTLGLCTYSIWAVVVVGVMKLSDGGNLIWSMAALSAAAGLGGHLVSLLLHSIHALRQWMRETLLCLWAAGTAVGCCLLAREFPGIGIGAAIFAALICGGLVFAGDGVRKRQPGFLLLLGVALVTLFCAAIVRLTMEGSDMDSSGFIWVFYVTAVVLTAGSNFANIDRHMNRRGHSMTRLPTRVRRNNLLLIAVLFLMAGLLIGFRRFFGRILMSVVRALVIAALWLASALSSLFGGGATDGGNMMPPASLDGYASDSSGGAGEWILWVIFGVIGILCVVFGVKPFVRWLREKLRDLRNRIREWLRRLGMERSRYAESEDYTDEVETVSDTGAAAEEAPGAAAKRRWRRETREYQRLPEGRDRFLTGYRLSVRGLRLGGVPILHSDTPIETAVKSDRLLQTSDFHEATDTVERLAFSPHEVPMEFAQLDEVLETLRKKL